MISQILLILLVATLVLGELTRIQLNNGIAFSGLDIVSILILIYSLASFIKNRSYLKSDLTKPILIFSVFAFISLVINLLNLKVYQWLVSLLYLVRFISLTSIYFFILNLPSLQKRKLPVFLLIAGFIFALLGFLQFVLYPNLKNLFYAGWDEHYLRLFSTFLDPNFAGLLLAMVFFLSLTLLTNSYNKNPFFIVILSLNSLFTFFAILFTLSRTAILTWSTGLIIFFLYKKSSALIPVALIIAIVMSVSITILGNLPTEGAHILRMPSSLARIDSMNHALTIFKDNPFFGVGFNAYRYAQMKHGYLEAKTWESSHAAAGADNSFLFILATTGILGVISFSYMVYKMISYSLKNRREYGLLGFISLLIILTGSFFINAFFYTPLLIWLYIILGLIENKSP